MSPGPTWGFFERFSVFVVSTRNTLMRPYTPRYRMGMRAYASGFPRSPLIGNWVAENYGYRKPGSREDPFSETSTQPQWL